MITGPAEELLTAEEAGSILRLSPQALKKYRDDAPAREEFTARHRALAAAIVEPLRSQLVALVRAHKTGEAVRRYKDASGLDYRTSIFVIDDLAHEGRP
jgi:hypothetical protein